MPQVSRHPRLGLSRASPINNRRGTVVRITFTGTTTWVVPASVRSVLKAYGKGADGTPESGYSYVVQGYHYYRTLWFQHVPQGYQSNPEEDLGWYEGSPTPSNYCDPLQSDGPDFNYFYCYRFVNEPHTEYNSTPAAPGANSSGLGRTFPGGAPAAAADITRFNNILVTPGDVYQFVVPAGGSITIEF